MFKQHENSPTIRPDLVFYTQSNSWIKVGVIMQPECLYGTAVEFQINISQEPRNVLPQTFVNMIGVSNNLLVDALKSGKIVDAITIIL